LLTGRPPFQAATPVETLEQVRDEEPVPPRRLQPKVARDLETICLKCLHKEPSRRYPNAAALAEDLDRFLHGRPVHARPVGLVGHTARWCRRKPMIAILAGLLILAVAGGLLTSLLLWRQAAGSEARALANLQNEEVARQEAEDTLRMTLQILEDNVVVSEALEGPDATPAQIDLLLHAEASYSHLLEKRGQDQKLQAQLAFVLVRLGNYYYSHAREIESLVFFEKATRLFEPLAPEGARQPEYIAAAVRAYSHLGFAYDLQGRLEQARQAFATSLCFWQELAKLPPTEPQCDAFVIGIQIARHLRDNSHSEKEIQDWFVHRPVGPEVLGGSQQYDLFLNLIRVMLTCYQESGQPVAKLAAARDGSAVLGRYYQDASLSRNGRFWLAIYSTEVGFFLRRSGASAEALDLLNRANRTLQELAVDTPEDPYLLAKLSHSWMHISRAHWELDQVNETMEDYRHSLAAQRQACLLAPAVTEYRQVLGQRYLQLVRKLCELGRLDVAEACLQERQALWPGDGSKHSQALREVRRWAGRVGSEGGDLSPEQHQERERYLDLCARMERKGIAGVSAAGSAKP
jgi:tetratricopeptide (TPR) repeat protein